MHNHVYGIGALILFLVTDTVTAFNKFYLLFQSTLPALFPINNLFKLAQETSKIDEVNNVAVKEGEKIDINEEKLTTKKDKRKLRHEKFLKSEEIHVSEYVSPRYVPR